jgi:MoaA/NifB/PqqE/SkfB family radical SAM enzyme
MNISELEDMVRLAAEFGLDGLFLWHANEGRGYDWVVERDGFTFDYRQQSLRAVPEECNRLLERALQLAADLGLEVQYDAVLRDFLLPEETSSRRRSRLRDCPYPWKEACVLSDGRVQFCPLQDIDEPLGRIGGRYGIVDVWNSEASRRTRELLASERIPDACRGSGCKYVRQAEPRHARR